MGYFFTCIDHYSGVSIRTYMPTPKLTLPKLLEKFNIVHPDRYDYSLVIDPSTRGYSDIVCKLHGAFRQRNSAHLLGQGCKKCRNSAIGDRLRFTKEDFIKDGRKCHGDLYNYDKFDYVTDKIEGIIICIKHNIEFSQTPANHKRSEYPCPMCSSESFSKKIRNTIEQTLELCHKKHGNGFDYSEIPEDAHSHDRVTITCNTCHNKFQQLLYSHTNIGNGCPVCKVSKEEKLLGDFIKNELDIEIIRSDRKILEGKEIDILIPSHNIGVEIHGNYWHSELICKEEFTYHLNKTKKSEDKGIQLFQFFEDEIKHKKDICYSIIRNKLGKALHKIYARKCIIKEVEIKDKDLFLNENHIQGKDKSRIKFGLYFNDELVSLMTFGKPRQSNKAEWELVRFCNKQNTSVVGAASKLFQYFIKLHNPQSIISYADKRISQGNIYDVLKFEHTHDALPRYHYMHKKNYLKRYHRSNFTKDRIKKLYPEVDLSMTEWDIMQSLGYDRIWDCGNKVYVWNSIQ